MIGVTGISTKFWLCYGVMSDLSELISGVNTLVPVVGDKRRRYINLDNAATTPPFKSVLQTVNDFSSWYSSVHRGNGFKSRLSSHAYEEARQIVGEFFGASAEDHVVIFVKNTTEAINKLSYRLDLQRKDIVLISHLEHHSNDLPWRAHATVKRIGLTSKAELTEPSSPHFSKNTPARLGLWLFPGHRTSQDIYRILVGLPLRPMRPELRS